MGRALGRADTVMDAFRFGTATFATFGLLGPLGGPYNTAHWAKQLRDSRAQTSEMAIYLIQFLWFLERITAGLGMWFFLLTDWSDSTFFIAIEALFFFYAVLDWYCWPGLYFYPMEQRNYYFVAGTYILGVISLIVAWILMIVKRSFTTTGFFYTSFALMVVSTLVALILGAMLVYVHRGSGIFSSSRGRAPALK